MDFFGLFLGKSRNPLKNPRQNSNQDLGVSRPKSTLQESGLKSRQSQSGPNRLRIARTTQITLRGFSKSHPSIWPEVCESNLGSVDLAGSALKIQSDAALAYWIRRQPSILCRGGHVGSTPTRGTSWNP